MSELCKADVTMILGRELSDAVVAEIIATGVTADQLAVARDRALRDRRAHDPGPRLDPGPMAHAVEILERLHGRGILGEGGSTMQ